MILCILRTIIYVIVCAMRYAQFAEHVFACFLSKKIVNVDDVVDTEIVICPDLLLRF